MNHRKGKIKDFALGIYDGPHATPKESDSGAIFLGIKNISPEGRIDFSDIRYVSEEEFPRWTKRVTPQKDDVVLSYEATLHRYALIPEGFRGCLGRRMALIRPDQSKLNPRFLHYYFLSQKWRSVVEANIIIGATVNRIPIKTLPDFEVEFPTLPEQQKIASILSSYDDLIENNRRRIQLLEESARLLYKEWFVHLRFPGHEHTKITDGVPEGWKKKPLGSVASVKSGFAFKSQDWTENGYPVIKIKNIVGDNTVEIIPSQCVDETATEKANRFLLSEGDLLIAMTGATVGKVGIVPKLSTPVYLNQRVGLFRYHSSLDLTPFLLPFFNSEIGHSSVVNLASGAAQPNISGGQIESIPLLFPKNSVLTSYLDCVVPAFKQRLILFEQNLKLSQARDLLLPKLMNGEIEV